MAPAGTRVSWLWEETPVWPRTLTVQSRISTDPRLSACTGWNQILTGSRKKQTWTGVLETGGFGLFPTSFVTLPKMIYVGND